MGQQAKGPYLVRAAFLRVRGVRAFEASGALPRGISPAGCLVRTPLNNKQI